MSVLIIKLPRHDVWYSLTSGRAVEGGNKIYHLWISWSIRKSWICKINQEFDVEFIVESLASTTPRLGFQQRKTTVPTEKEIWSGTTNQRR